MKMIAASLSRRGTTTWLSTNRTTTDRADDASPTVLGAILAAVPSLRAFAISFSSNIDRADDLVQETLLRAIPNINSFQPG
jgi:DNA-directed RNA polymerase specialized sigma24 family protein